MKGLAFGRRNDLVLQNHRIHTVAALHTPQDDGEIIAGVVEFVAPLVHQQAAASGAGSRVELIARGKELNSPATPDLCRSFLSQCFS